LRHERNGTGVGGADQIGEVESEQFGDGEEEAGRVGPELSWEGVEIDLLGSGQGREGGAAASCVGTRLKASEALLAQDLGDPGAIERGRGVLEGGGDLVDR
jgi:hypothetical protein